MTIHFCDGCGRMLPYLTNVIKLVSSGMVNGHFETKEYELCKECYEVMKDTSIRNEKERKERLNDR